MQSDEDFNVKFVGKVKQYKCLYDKKAPEYRNKDEQEKAWLEIALETRESVSHCKERWRNLRACLSRYIKQQSGSDPQHKPYYLSDHMAFLVPFLKSHRSHDFSDSFNDCDLKSDINIEMKHSDVDETSDREYDNSTRYKYPLKVSNRHRLSENDTTQSINCVGNVQVDIDPSEPDHEVLFTTSTDRTEIDAKRLKLASRPDIVNSTIASAFAENSDMAFFRSILPDIAGMSAMQKRKFKIGVLQLVDDVLLKFPDASQMNSDVK